MTSWYALLSDHPTDEPPFDGEPVLIVTNHRHGSRVHRARWTDSIHSEGIFGWAVDDCKFGPYALRGYTIVTHWMPLPEPPPVPSNE